MSIKVGINGFGRIGRIVFRIAFEQKDMEIVGINDPFLDAAYMKYLLKYDSVHGRYPREVEALGNALVVDGKRIDVFSVKDPSAIPWDNCGAEYIIEASGAFTKAEKARAHIEAGAKKVVITAPSSDSPIFVMGVNEEAYSPDMDVVPNASCTTNCLAPLVKVVNDKFGIEEALMSTVHSMTGSQKVVDSPAGRDWRAGRSASHNIVPATTGAASAVARVIPELEGRITGMAFRVPTLDVSVVDLTARLKTPVTITELNAEIKRASENEMRGTIGYTEDKVVSSDFIGDAQTCIFDAASTMLLGDRFCKLVAWYDNEYGYSNKVVQLTKYIAEQK